MKYNKGDRVRIIRKEQGSETHFNYEIGEIAIIIDPTVSEYGSVFCTSETGRLGQYVPVGCIELVERKKPVDEWCIKIVPNGEKTTATLYKAGKEIKSATVKRYKEDKYSIPAATEYAVKKLFEKKKKEKKENGFKVGARVVGVGEQSNKNIDGCIGTIRVVLCDEGFGVEFDKNIGGHNIELCDCKFGHGWYCHETHLKLL